MIENILEMVIGQLPEAIYFALFIILTKQLKTKRLLFIVIEIIEYLMLFKVFPNSIWSRICFFIMTYIVLKILYKDKAQIIDIFTLGIASLILIITSIILYYPILFLCDNYIVYVVVSRLVLFLLLFLTRNKLPKIQKLYKKFWNRNDNIKKRMKSTTFRAMNTVIFNTMFFVLNFGIIVSI